MAYGKPLGQSLDNGSSSEALGNEDTPNVGSSYFDLSMVHTTTVEPGALVPVDVLKLVLGDRLDIKFGMYIDVSNPLVKPLLSRVRAYVHYYYNRFTDLWHGAKNYYTHGRRSSRNLALPALALEKNFPSVAPVSYFLRTTSDTTFSYGANKVVTFDNPMSLSSYFGLSWLNHFTGLASGSMTIANVDFPCMPYGNYPMQYKFASYRPHSAHDTSKTDYLSLAINPLVSLGGNLGLINALPFVMYQRLYRDFYLNKNLSQNNQLWFPDNEDDFMLPYDCKIAYSVMNDGADGLSLSDGAPCTRYEIVPNNGTTSTDWDSPVLPALRYRQWRGDYFTEALPWQYRGDEPLVGVQTLNIPSATVVLGGVAGRTDIIPFAKFGSTTISSGSNSPSLTVWNNSSAYTGSGTDYPFVTTAQQLQVAGFSANNIRELFTLATLRERMAKTNGDYNSLMKSYFGISPHSDVHTAIYVGGAKVDLNVSEVESSVSTASEPLGSVAGRLSAVVTADVGNFVAPDGGYLMAILSICPDVVYSNQGLPRWLRGSTTASDEYIPLFNNLAPQDIRTSEIFAFSPNSDTTLFGWIDRYMDYKTRQNRVSGLLQLPSDIDNFYSSRVWTRYFDTEPVLGNAFVTMCPPTIQRNIFSSPLDPAFIVQFASKIGAVRKMPFTSKPAGLNGYAM